VIKVNEIIRRNPLFKELICEFLVPTVIAISTVFRVEPKLEDEEERASFRAAIKLLEEMALFLKPNQSSQLSRCESLLRYRYITVFDMRVGLYRYLV